MKKYFQAPWSIKELIVIIIFSSTLIFLLTFGLSFLSIEEYLENQRYKSLILIGIFLMEWILALFPLLIYTAKKHKFKWKHFGFKKIKILPLVGYVLSGFFLYFGIIFIISAFILYNDIQIPGFKLQESPIPIFGIDNLGLIVAGITIIGIAPIIEELLFRGFLLRTLSDKIGIYWGSIISALLFSALHIPWSSFIPIFIIGLIINSIVIRSKSLWPAIAFHIFNNAIAFTVQILILKDVINVRQIL